jgi:hypothetical protein
MVHELADSGGVRTCSTCTSRSAAGGGMNLVPVLLTL